MERIPGTELEFGTPRGLEQTAWERFPGRMVQGDVQQFFRGPNRLKAGGHTSQAEGSEDGPARMKALEGGPNWLKVLRVVQIG